ncbi:hypothetical protein BO86DRAFT_139826 [Aspergillus japonicus CBS 114.51]|uniref:Uncharacterized protein n=1 Tax=Aspergillus japonicus CBS 114.51 TaxID=1448312 RepID=A0A8T8XDC8_ASPJA|nr:hypothetical protein BO86DRAFT_139826 [Aspergillus japonicus CBS 114.51]RAH86145.1 hypothetical protein BO86DRAFT_139826 [Aspergillus japonicus CBS 114.51]
MDSSILEPSQPVASDEVAMAAVRDLTDSIKALIKLIDQANERRDPSRVREQARQNDPILSALNEEIQNGRPKHAPPSKPVQLMSPEEIDAENEANMAEYTDFWKEHKSTPAERQTMESAYEAAFDQFPTIYRTLGWHGNDDILFDAKVLSRYRDTLLEGLFAIEPHRMNRIFGPLDTSRAAFEYSRLPRLLSILVRMEARRNDALECRDGVCVDCRYFDADQTLRVLIEVGRTLRLSRLGGPNEMTLQELLDRCYARHILSQPAPDKPEILWYQHHLVYDCLTALEFESQFREIRDPLSLTFYLRHKDEPIYKIFEMVKSHRSVMISIEPVKELPLDEASSPTFAADTFTVQYLQDFGGLNIEWTDCLDDHLKIFAGRNAIRVFAHPTFFYNGRDLQKKDYLDPIYNELSQTYALLFRPSSNGGLGQLRKVNKSEEVPWPARRIEVSERLGTKTTLPGTFEIDVRRPSVKRILENFHRCSLPPTIQAAFDIAGSAARIKGVGSFDQNKITPKSMQEIHSRAPYYPEDIKFMITSIFQHDVRPNQAFLHYEYFGPRLRRLKTYLDTQQPKTLKQLWVDRRDARAWWTFWGGAFLLLFLVLSAMSAAFLAAVARRHG